MHTNMQRTNSTNKNNHLVALGRHTALNSPALNFGTYLCCAICILLLFLGEVLSLHVHPSTRARLCVMCAMYVRATSCTCHWQHANMLNVFCTRVYACVYSWVRQQAYRARCFFTRHQKQNTMEYPRLRCVHCLPATIAETCSIPYRAV